MWKWSLKTGDFALLLTELGGLWLGMTGSLSIQVKMYAKPISALESGLIRQTQGSYNPGTTVHVPVTTSIH